MSRLKRYLSLFINKSVLLLAVLALVLVFDETPAPAAENAQPLQLLSRSPQHAVLPNSLMTPEQEAWLVQKKVLTLGVSNPQYPPFDIINNRSEFEGITADYVGLIEEMLNVKVEVKIFASRRSALRALQNHEIDLLSSATQFDQHEADILLSEPYASEQSVLVTHAALNGAEGVSLLLQGKSNNDISQLLNRSPKTTSAQKKSLLKKLKVSSFAELISLTAFESLRE